MNAPIRTTALIFAMMATLLVAGCGGNGADAGAVDTEAAVAAVDAPQYSAISSGKVDVEGGLVDIAARAPGIVTEVYVQEGDSVVKDQILAKQDDEDAILSRNRTAAQLRQAEAQIPILEVQLEAAQREENRLKRLIENSAVSEQTYE